jgi:hypothetical protein
VGPQNQENPGSAILFLDMGWCLVKRFHQGMVPDSHALKPVIFEVRLSMVWYWVNDF